MVRLLYRSSAVLCMALTLAPTLSMAGSETSHVYRSSDVLELITAKSSLPKLSSEKVRNILQSASASVKNAKSLSAQELLTLSKFKFGFVSDHELKIETPAGLVRLEAIDLANGEIRLNGMPLSLDDVSTREELRSKVQKILNATLSSSAQHAGWEFISSSYAVAGIDDLVLVGVVLVIMEIGNLASNAIGCSKVDNMAYVAKTNVDGCLSDEKELARDPSIYSTSGSKQLLDLLKSTKDVLPVSLVKGKAQPEDMNKVDRENYWRPASHAFLDKEKCDIRELRKNVSDLTSCLNRVQARASANLKSQAQSGLVDKSQKPSSVGTYSTESSSEAAPGKIAR